MAVHAGEHEPCFARGDDIASAALSADECCSTPRPEQPSSEVLATSTTATPRIFSHVIVPEARARHSAAAGAALDGAAMAGQAVDGSPAADAAVEGSSAAGAPTGACMPEAVDPSCGSNRYNATWGVTFRPTTSGFCDEFGRGKVGCSNCPGCTLATLLNGPGPCQYAEGCEHQCTATDNQRHDGICYRHREGPCQHAEGCVHQCTANDNQRHDGICYRHRGGPCQHAGCVHQCTARDNQRHGGICGLHRDGGVKTAAAATNASNPKWTDEEKNILSELAGKHTDASGKVQWNDVMPLLPGNRTHESARNQWVRMRKAATLPRVIAPTLPGYDGDPNAAALLEAPASRKRQKTAAAELEQDDGGGCFCGADHLQSVGITFNGMSHWVQCDDSWIQCDDCDRWCHSQCAGFDKQSAEEAEAYSCPTCS